MSQNIKISSEEEIVLCSDKNDASSETINFENRSHGLSSSSIDYNLVDDKWFYMYPTASDSSYKTLRENHPNLDSVKNFSMKFSFSSNF